MTYCFVGLYRFPAAEAKLTPLFYKVEEDHKFYFYAVFSELIGNPDKYCPSAIQDELILETASCICNVIKNPKVLFYNTFLNVVLLSGLILNSMGIYMQYWNLKGQYFRFQNMIQFIQSLDLMLTPLIWYILAEDAGNFDCAQYGSFVILMPLMGGLHFICYAWGRFYAKKLEFARTVKNLLSDNSSGTDESDNYEYQYDGSDEHMTSPSPHSFNNIEEVKSESHLSCSQ